jgi:glycosyltransferase involved in cell wall biosynthesis
LKTTTTNFDSVLHVGPNFRRRKGGIASVLKMYSESIDNFKFYPSAITQNIYINLICFPFVLLGFVLYLSFIKIELVHIHGASKGSFFRKYFFFLIATKMFDKKIIYHIHGGKYHYFYEHSSSFVRSCIKEMIQEVDTIIVMTESWQEYFKKTFRPKEIQVLQNPVREPEPYQKEYCHPPLKLVFMGKIHEEKGIFDLVKTIHLNKAYFKGKIELTIAGTGEEKKLMGLIEKYKLNDTVEYIGWISGNKKRELLLQSDIMILPSYFESLGIVLLEGMSYSMALIGSKVGGIPKLLKPGENGLFIKPGNKKDLTKAIEFYIKNPQKVRVYGQKSYANVNAFFPSAIFEKLNKIYKSKVE